MYLSSLHPRAKTDKLDGLGLALYGLTHPLHTYTLKSEAVDQLDQLLCARKGLSRALSSLRLQADDLPRAKETLRPSIDHLAQQIRLLDKQIAAITGDTAHPEFAAAKRLQQITGVGPVTAAAVASRLSAKQFSHPDEFVAYAGLDIRVAQSGKRNGQLGLTKRGDAEIRRLLFVCAKATLTAKDNPFKAQYERERAKGMSATAALCAVARKLACVCWSLHRHGTDYDPERVATRPEPKKRTDSST
jgi:transposase